MISRAFMRIDYTWHDRHQDSVYLVRILGGSGAVDTPGIHPRQSEFRAVQPPATLPAPRATATRTDAPGTHPQASRHVAPSVMPR